jgi:hypothetical protein
LSQCFHFCSPLSPHIQVLGLKFSVNYFLAQELEPVPQQSFLGLQVAVCDFGCLHARRLRPPLTVATIVVGDHARIGLGDRVVLEPDIIAGGVTQVMAADDYIRFIARVVSVTGRTTVIVVELLGGFMYLNNRTVIPGGDQGINQDVFVGEFRFSLAVFTRIVTLSFDFDS